MTLNRPPHSDESGRWTPADFLAAGTVVLIGGAVRLVHVAVPPERIFDERYYAKDACLYAKGSASICRTAAEVTAVHPPLGKWLMAAGIRGFGYNPLGWRVAALLAGAATIGLLYLLARELFRSTFGATFAAGLLAIDPLHFVQSRVAMLDVFVPLFGCAAFYFVLLDRNRILRRRAAPEARLPLLNRPWRVAAGVAAGAATASKWSGALVAVTLIALTVAWEAASRRTDGRPRPVRRALADEGPSILLWLVGMPVIVYTISYAGVLDGTWGAEPWSEGSWVRVFVERQVFMLNFHLGLNELHSYGSPAWSWILIRRPVSYYFTDANGDYREILAAGNPLVWWSSLLALVYAGIGWVRHRSPERPQGFILAGFLLSYGPWLVIATGRSAVFLFYLLPTVPFMCLALSYVMVELVRSLAGRTATGLFATACVVTFAFYYPLLAAVPLSPEQWQRRIWVFDHCDKPAPIEGLRASKDLPPQGWCWI